MKKNRLIILTLLTLAIVCILLYLYGFTYSFRNFAGTADSWKPLQQYEIRGYKENVDQNINDLVVKNNSMFDLSRDKNKFSKGISTLRIMHPEDTSEFTFKFHGDSASWVTTAKSTILLLSIAGKHHDISSTNLENTDKIILKSKIELFENYFVFALKNKFK